MKILTPRQVGEMLTPPLTIQTVLHHIKVGHLQAMKNGPFYAITYEDAECFITKHNAGGYRRGSTPEQVERRRHTERELAAFKTFADASLMERVAREMTK